MEKTFTDGSISFINFDKMIEDGWDALEISISCYWRLYDLLYGLLSHIFQFL